MYNWAEIKQEWLDGKTMTVISEERGSRPTIGAISKKAKQEHWEAMLSPNRGTRKPKADNPDIRSAVLDYLGHGATYTLAAAATGIHVTSLERWRREDEEFDLACKQAHAMVPTNAMRQIVLASESGDMSASRFLAERHPDSKHDLGPPQPQAGNAATIIFQIPRDVSELPAPNRVIEHDSEVD